MLGRIVGMKADNSGSSGRPDNKLLNWSIESVLNAYSEFSGCIARNNVQINQQNTDTKIPPKNSASNNAAPRPLTSVEASNPAARQSTSAENSSASAAEAEAH